MLLVASRNNDHYIQTGQWSVLVLMGTWMQAKYRAILEHLLEAGKDLKLGIQQYLNQHASK